MARRNTRNPVGAVPILGVVLHVILNYITSSLEKCKTLRGEPELIMSCTHDSLKFLGAKWNLLNNKRGTKVQTLSTEHSINILSLL